MKRLLRFAAVAAACILSDRLSAQILYGEAQLVSGSILIRPHKNDKTRAVAAAPNLTPIWRGAVLLGGTGGGEVRIHKSDGTTELRNLAAGEERIFPAPTDPRLLQIISDADRLLVANAGASRSDSTKIKIYAPTNGSALLPGALVKLRWQALAPGTNLRFEVFPSDPKDDKPLWSGTSAGTTGSLDSAELATKLTAYSRGGTHTFFLHTFVDKDEEPDERPFRLLTRDEQAQLDSNLEACNQTESGPLRHLLRAGVYRRFGVLGAASDEFDQLLSDPEYGKRADIIKASHGLAPRDER
jgi:hypothetical protein